MSTKKEIRRLVKERLLGLSEQEIDRRGERIAEKVLALPAYREAKSVFVYLSTDREAPTRPIIARALAEGKKVLLPRVEGEDMALVPYSGGETMLVSGLGILEPLGEKWNGTPDLALIPLVAFDRSRNRLGRGKGYYDCFLATYGGTSVALAFSEQECATVPVEPFDRRPDRIVTEKEILE